MERHENTAYTLYELNNIVRQVIEGTLNQEYWVAAELSEARQSNGHCYMELIEKDERLNTPVARASAKCWRSTWVRLLPKFLAVTDAPPRAGMKVMLKVYPQFHEAYGFSWIVTDIDPTYTLGEMARRRLEIIRILKEEGVMDLNKQLPLPMFAQRIAVVSSPTAAGYGDFVDQLQTNKYGYKFGVRLFPAIMQGEGVEQSVISALNEIFDEADSFDCVVIIRGGGATSDLSGFDTLALAENIANFPLPVITGIGHDRDETVADMVANTKVKTPTAAAALLIDNLCKVDERLSRMQQVICNNARLLVQHEQQRLQRLAQMIPMQFSLSYTRQMARVENLSQRLVAAARQMVTMRGSRLEMTVARLKPAAEQMLQTERHRQDMLAQRLSALDPQAVLDRGYSITTCDGKAVTDSGKLTVGDKIVTRLAKGKVKSIIEKQKE